MKVALVHVRENYTPAPPMGIVSIGTVLRDAGHEVLVIDSFPHETEKNIERVRAFNPGIVGLSVLTTQYMRAKYFTAKARAALPGALICWGGIHATSLPEETLFDAGLDFVVVGEGEVTMKEVCERLEKGAGLEGVAGVVYRDNDCAVRNPVRPVIEDLDSLPIPDRKLLGDYSWYLLPPGILRGMFKEGVTTFYTSRGCPASCIFCSSNTLFGRRLRKRSVENVIKEIRTLVSEFGVKGLYFNDDTFGVDREWLARLCAGLKESGLNLFWGCQTRANLVTEEMLRMMKDAGCVQVDIGSESGSGRILKIYKKGITTQDIRNAFALIKKAGLKSCTTFILGAPGETREDIEMTLALARELPAMVSFLILVPYPGSALYPMALENKWFETPDILFDERWANKQSQEPVMNASRVPLPELVSLRAQFENEFCAGNYAKTVFSFLTHPGYLFKIAAAVMSNAGRVVRSAKKAFAERKAVSLLEDIYQIYNEHMRRVYGGSGQ